MLAQIGTQETRQNALIDHPLTLSAHGIFLSDGMGSRTHKGMVMPLVEKAEALGTAPSFSTVTRCCPIGKRSEHDQATGPKHCVKCRKLVNVSTLMQR